MVDDEKMSNAIRSTATLGILTTGLLFGWQVSAAIIIAIATIAVKNGAIGQEEYASFIVAALMEDIVIMTLIQFLMFLFQKLDMKNKEKIG